MQGSAHFASKEEFSWPIRWRLDRWWGDGPRALVCGANPSKATATTMDPTMHRCVSLLRPHWPGFTMVNASPYVATDPREHALWAVVEAHNPRLHAVRERNLAAIREASGLAGVRIAAWGNLVQPSPELLDALSCGGRYPIMCWGVTKFDSPLHPLARGKAFIPADRALSVWIP